MSSLNEQLNGREYWRSLQERMGDPRLLAELEQEFPGYDPQAFNGLSRRSFMQIMGASLALAGLTLTGCRRWPEQELRPQTKVEEGTAPGLSQYYATMMELSGIATGVLAKSYNGRPIKIEGNPRHPFSLGAADAWMQASVLDMYDPDRSRKLLERGNSSDGPQTRTWAEFAAFASIHFGQLRAAGGRGLAVLSRSSGSPTLLRLRAEFLKTFPQATWHCYEPIHRDNEIAGAKAAFGRAMRAQYHLEKAAVIACFDADLLGLHPAHQRLARDWATGRASADQGKMNRVYVAESSFTLTGSVADQRLPIRATRTGALLSAVAAAVGVGTAPKIQWSAAQKQWIDLLAADLLAHRGAAVVAVGAAQPAEVHALAHAINAALGNQGQTITFTQEPQGDEAGCVDSIRTLSKNIEAGHVSTLLILDGNPIYDAPADVNLSPDKWQSITTIHLAANDNETSQHCRWHLPAAHYLECWGDGCAWDGTYSVQQPLIEPLWDGKSPAQLLAMVLGQADVSGLELVRKTAKTLLELNTENSWDRLLHDGVLARSQWPTIDVGKPKMTALAAIAGEGGSEMEVVFVPDASVYDGRFANNGWLQELPDPLTKLTWDNAALINPNDATRLGITTGDIVRLNANGRAMEIVAYVMPGLAQGVIALALGYGRQHSGHVGKEIGFNTYALRTAAASYIATSVQVIKTGRQYKLAMTQAHHLIDSIGMWGREERIGTPGKSGHVVNEATLAEYVSNPQMFHEEKSERHQLFEGPSKFDDPHAWGMTIDANKCLGCNACVASCQAENNIPIVGKKQVANKREMHWLRVDLYFKGDVENPEVVHLPVACSHCENAPCEQVCPVAATVHDAEGLNTMVYNRCIGTRYCSNNCPVKVRRFNYFDFHATDPRGTPRPWLGIPDQEQQQVDAVKRMVYNPEVTVRMRGVMEKCTYCVQRVQAAKIHAKVAHAQGLRADDLVEDGEVMTACQTACPTQAIQFGNLKNTKSQVAQSQANPRSYELLEELNLRSRTRYLAKISNPPPEGAGPAATQTPHTSEHA